MRGWRDTGLADGAMRCDQRIMAGKELRHGFIADQLLCTLRAKQPDALRPGREIPFARYGDGERNTFCLETLGGTHENVEPLVSRIRPRNRSRNGRVPS